MPFADIYRRQVALLIRLLPLIAEEKGFAVKGGTAINLFVRDMPRLSVDIDLTYVPIESYEASLAAIDAAMGRIAASVKARIPARLSPKVKRVPARIFSFAPKASPARSRSRR